MGRGKSREKILHELLTRCPGSFCLDHSTNVMGTSSCQRVCYPITYQHCIKDSRGISPSAHEGELCHCLLLILAPCVIIINPSEPVSQSYCCRSPKPVTFTLHLSISRSLHPTNPWNTLIVSVRHVLLVTIELPLQNNKNQQTFFLLLSKKVAGPWQRGFPWQVEDRRGNGSWSSSSEEVFSRKLKVMVCTSTYSCNTQNCSVLSSLLKAVQDYVGWNRRNESS